MESSLVIADRFVSDYLLQENFSAAVMVGLVGSWRFLNRHADYDIDCEFRCVSLDYS